MLRLALRNLVQRRARLVAAVGGVALALVLILSLDAIFTGVEEQVTAYVDRTGAEIFVSQEGVRTMHMASSWLPADVVDRVRAVEGVASATPILYLTNVVAIGSRSSPAYVIGLPPDAPAGGPWRIVQGAPIPAAGEAIVDRGVAERSGAGVGDAVTILGSRFTIGGLSEGTATIVSSVAFVSLEDFARLRGDDRTVSFVLVTTASGESPDAVAARIAGAVDGVTVQTRAAFADEERRVIRDMSTDVIAIMNLVGFLIGLAVMAFTVYTATLSRRAEYGVLKALGARNSHLYRTVLAQALVSVAFGFGLALVLTLVLTVVVPRTGLDLVLRLSGGSLLKVGAVSLVIAGGSALLPIRQIAGLDPAIVFRGGTVR